MHNSSCLEKIHFHLPVMQWITAEVFVLFCWIVMVVDRDCEWEEEVVGMGLVGEGKECTDQGGA